MSSSDLHPVWRDYRTRRRLLAFVLVTVPVLALAVASLRGAGPGSFSAHLLLSAWSTSFVGALAWFARFRCPFCARHFHWTWLVANPLSRECLHCGFKKWRAPDAARAYTGR